MEIQKTKIAKHIEGFENCKEEIYNLEEWTVTESENYLSTLRKIGILVKGADNHLQEADKCLRTCTQSSQEGSSKDSDLSESRNILDLKKQDLSNMKIWHRTMTNVGNCVKLHKKFYQTLRDIKSEGCVRFYKGDDLRAHSKLINTLLKAAENVLKNVRKLSHEEIGNLTRRLIKQIADTMESDLDEVQELAEIFNRNASRVCAIL